MFQNGESSANQNLAPSKVRLTLPAASQRQTPQNADYEDEEAPVAVQVVAVNQPPQPSTSSQVAAAATQVLQAPAPVTPQQAPAVAQVLQPPVRITQAHQALAGQILPGPSQPQLIAPRPNTLVATSGASSFTPLGVSGMCSQEAAMATQALLSANNLYQLSQPVQQTTSVKRKASDEDPAPTPKAKKPR